MMRNSVLASLTVVIASLLLATFGVVGEEKSESQSGENQEVIDQFLQSLQPSDEDAGEDSDRCPGETEADRNTEEPAPVRSPYEAEDTPSPKAATAELTDEPKTLPDSIDAAPIGSGKSEGSKKLETKPRNTSEKAATPSADEELSPELLKLKRKVRDTLGWYYDHPQKVTDRSPWGIMHWLIPYGVDSVILDAKGQRQNTVGYLCYNYPCRGQRLFHLENGQIAAYIGPGLQGHRGQFLAMLAQSKVDPAYPMLVEGRQLKVADLIEYEKRTCEAGTELTFKLIALAHYLKHDEKWKNNRGEDWDIPRLIREELKQSVVGSACGGTHRMTGFSYAVRKHEARGLFMEGQWLRAGKFIDAYHDYTYTLQNRDGSFSTNWFASRGDLADPQRRLQTSGHMLEWLVYSLPEQDLKNKNVVAGVDYLTNLLHDGTHVRWEIGPLGHALHALALYDERVFGGKPGQRAQQLVRRPGNTMPR